jgi:trk system potassium uptake protein
MPSLLSLRVRRHETARLVCATGLVVLAQAVVDDPAGLLGRAHHVTLIGAVYAGLAVVLGGLVAWAWQTHTTWARRLSPLLYALHLLLFLPALADDPAVAGMVVVWMGGLLLGRVFPWLPPEARQVVEADPQRERLHTWLQTNGPAARHLLAVAVLATVVVVGFALDSGPWVLATCLALDALALGLANAFVWRLLRAGHHLALVLFGLELGCLTLLLWPTLLLATLAVFLTVCLAILWLQGSMARELADFFLRRPAALAVISFAAVIALGTLLLSFPLAAASGQRIAVLDALFTATSATCVTGLTVLDTATAFSPFGQAVILGLIQVGGLGIIILSTFATLLVGGRLGLKGGQALAESLGTSGAMSADRLVMFVVLSTLGIEAVGALALTSSFLWHGFALGEAVWRGVFHAVSAFCNAGFALQSDNLIAFQRDPVFLLVISALITLGGIGFLVLTGVWLRLRTGRPGPLWMSVQVVAWCSLALVVLGAVLIGWNDWNDSLAGLPWGYKLVNALFHSVTARTAGFNSTDMGALAPGTPLVMMALMFIGASPGGTGGGIKTTTLVILLGCVRAIAQGENRVVLFNRQVAQTAIFRAVVLLLLALGIWLVALLVLQMTQHLPFESLAFESVSALGTVGLSLNATPLLDPTGKLVIALTMFAGRLGPLTFALLWSRTQEARIGYPEAPIPVG